MGPIDAGVGFAGKHTPKRAIFRLQEVLDGAEFVKRVDFLSISSVDMKIAVVCTRNDRTTAARVGAQPVLTSVPQRRTMPEEMHRHTMHRETERRRGVVSWWVRTCQNARAIRGTFFP